MTDLFLDVLNASYAASFLVLAVILARLLLKKAPRWMVCGLWALVALRLLVPAIPETAFSVVPSSQLISPQSLYDTAPQIQSGISSIDNVINPIYSESLRPAPGASINPLQVWLAVYANLWILGVAAMTLWAFFSWQRVRKQVRESIPSDGVFLCDRISSPFIFGLVRPQIYLPSDLDGESRGYVIAHEKAHLRRRDHWWKPLGFALLTVNWFNPLLWVAYVLLCRDIEMACDEKVVRDLSVEEKKAYSAALLRCSANPRRITACPLAFGEVGVKQRIRSVLHYKKPAFWIILVTALVATVLAAGLLTNPESGNAEIRWDNVLYIQEGKAVLTLPENAALAGSLDSILLQEAGQPEYQHPDKNGQAVHLGDSYVGQPMYLSEGKLYLMEPGGKIWLPFVPKHTTQNVTDLLKGNVQCNLVLRGEDVSIIECLTNDGNQALRDLLGTETVPAYPTLDWTWEMAVSVNYVEDICFVIDSLDFEHHTLLTRREDGWMLIYRDSSWAVSAWTFQSPQLDAFITPWQQELAFANEQFSPFSTGEDSVYLEYHTASLSDVSVYVGVPTAHIGPDVTDTHWEYQSSVSHQDRTIRILCRPFGRQDWMKIEYFDHNEAINSDWQTEPITLSRGASGTLYHDGDPDRWAMISLNTTRGQLLITAPNAENTTDWTEADHRMARAITETIALCENGNSLLQEPNALGITLKLQNVTPSGATLVCIQDGTLWDEIITGAPWNLERYEDGNWNSVMPESTVWTTIAYLLEPGSTSSWNLNWNLIVGSLGPGRYRVSKTFTGVQNPIFTLGQEKTEVRQTCYAEFTIEEPLLSERPFSQQIYDAVLADWEAHASMSLEQQFSFSKMPGSCIQEFDDWTQVEQFIGMQIPNPLENLDTLEKGCWAGTPVGYNGASRFYISWYGNREGQIEWVTVESGYRRDQFRVCVKAELCSDIAQTEPVITENAGMEYEACTAQLTRGSILYTIRVIGETGTGDQLMAVLAELLPYFEELPLT